MAKLRDSKIKETKKTTKFENNRKVTHLYLNDKYLSSIGILNGYVNLTVLYLFNNYIEKIERLDNVINLRSLYLQRNKITKIENLDALSKLQRLYLGHNEISVVENLDKLKHLEELHIEKQNLGDGEELCFDPRSIQCLSHNLEVLNVSGNKLSTVIMLGPLKYLRLLNASNNNICHIDAITDTLKQLVYLKEANFMGNPISKEHRYKESVIGKSINLRILDGKDITDITRSFIKRFEIEKNNLENRDVIKLPKNVSSISKNYPPALQKAVSNFMLKPTSSSDVVGLPQTTSNAYIPWKCMPSTFNDKNNRNKVPPLLRRQKKNPVRIVNLASLPNLL